MGETGLTQLEEIAGIGFLVVFVVLLLELPWIRWRRGEADWREVRMTLLGIASQGFGAALVLRLAGPLTVAIAALAGAPLRFVDGGTTWPWWLYGFVVYEFWYWVQHWAAHKVRLLWCIHAPHHAPRGISMAIGANHSAFESALWFPLFFGFIPALCGVDPLICVAVNLVDAMWGSFLHLSEEAMPGGRYGPLERVLQTPSYHRAHHARNPLYIDTNYNSITLLWDSLLGTKQRLEDGVEVEYGITRDVDTGSFWDVHFGEFVALFRDMRGAPSLGAALGYALRPPGWQPGDASGTASAIRARGSAQG